MESRRWGAILSAEALFKHALQRTCGVFVRGVFLPYPVVAVDQVQAFEEQLQRADLTDLSFDDRLACLVEREYALRSNRQLTYRLRRAQLKLNATLEDIDLRTRRGLDKALLNELARCGFITDHLNVLITGPPGVGKTYLACAIAHSACRNGYSARYLRVPRLLTDIAIARGDGSYHKRLTQFAKTDLVIFDDWVANMSRYSYSVISLQFRSTLIEAC